MLMVLHPEKADAAEAMFRKWGLDFAIIGKTTAAKRFVVRHRGEVKADLPIKELGDEAPVYDRPWTPTPPSPVLGAGDLASPLSTGKALLKLLGSPDLGSKRWVYEQYDSLILGNTVEGPGGDAAVVRLGDGPKGLALTTDVTERYCEADPVQGGRQAVAEAWRNLVAVGARPLALTDNLNFGNPEKPAAMGQLVGCLQGIAEASRALDFPIVSGNVSLYNETMGAGIPPTPSIGGVGLLADVGKAASLAFRREGEAILLIGGNPGWLGRSAWLSTCLGREEGAPPPVDLAAERRNGEFVLVLIAAGRVSAVHDLSDGGLAVALAEMTIASGIGATIDPAAVEGEPHGFFFGEDQGRYVVTSALSGYESLIADAARADVPMVRIGATGGLALTLPDEAPIGVEALRKGFESWFPAFMEGSRS
jgi:phosphoribosylformylglycinamidine synthase